MDFEIIECKTTYGGLDTNISIIYINLSDYKIFDLQMSLDSVQDEILKTSTNKNGLINELVNKFHKYSKKLDISEMPSDLILKLRDYKLYELLK